jgi:hypothetical protein
VGKLLSTPFGIAELDRRILAVNEAQLPQSLTERFQTRRSRGRSAGQDADTRNTPGLLRARRERPRHRAAEKRDELASFQLIELHSVPVSQGRIAAYRISQDQSGGNGD